MSPATVKNCMGWTFSPLPQIGSSVGYLKTTPTGLDSASKVGCKSQSYTSWDCVSRSYVGGVYILAGDNQHPRPTRHAQTEETGDIPIPAEMARLSEHQRLLFDQGLRVFVRGRGLMSQHQFRTYMGMRRQVQAQPLRDVDTGLNQRVTRSTAAVQTTGEQAGEPAVVVPIDDQNLGYYYSDMLPVRCVAITTMISERESEPVPYSPQYQILAGRLNDPAQTGVLSSVVRRPNVRDATTMSSLVKAMSLRPSTRFEIAAMVRSGCMGMSVAEENYETDPIPYRFVRKAANVEYIGMSIQQKPHIVPEDWKIVAMPLDTFVALANNSYFATTPPDFSYSALDVSWTAVPVPSRLLGQSHLIAYIYSFLSSDAWSGTTSFKMTTKRDGPNNKKYSMSEYYLPVVNGVDIPGPKNVCMVLVDETSPNCPTTTPVRLRDVAVVVPVWRGPTQVMPVSSWMLWQIKISIF